MIEKCFNVKCVYNNADSINGCDFRTKESTDCFAFISQKEWEEKMMEKRTPESTGGSRQHARTMLLSKIKMAEVKVKALKTLEATINWSSLTTEQEELLYHYFIPGL